MLFSSKGAAQHARTDLTAHFCTYTLARLKPCIGIDHTQVRSMSFNLWRFCSFAHFRFYGSVNTPRGIKDEYQFTLAPWSTPTHSVFSVVVRRYQTWLLICYAACGKEASPWSAKCCQSLNLKPFVNVGPCPEAARALPALSPRPPRCGAQTAPCGKGAHFDPCPQRGRIDMRFARLALDGERYEASSSPAV
jgi:hypothetical protein